MNDAAATIAASSKHVRRCVAHLRSLAAYAGYRKHTGGGESAAADQAALLFAVAFVEAAAERMTQQQFAALATAADDWQIDLTGELKRLRRRVV